MMVPAPSLLCISGTRVSPNPPVRIVFDSRLLLAASTWISEYPGCHWGTSTYAISSTGSGPMRRVTSARMLWGKSFWFVFGVLTGRGTVSPRLAVRQARHGRLACSRRVFGQELGLLILQWLIKNRGAMWCRDFFYAHNQANDKNSFSN